MQSIYSISELLKHIFLMFLSLSQNLKYKSPNLSYTVKTFDLSCYIKQLLQNYVIFTQNQTLFSDNTHIQLMHKHYTAVITHYRDKCKTLHSGQSRGKIIFIMKYFHNPAHINVVTNKICSRSIASNVLESFCLSIMPLGMVRPQDLINVTGNPKQRGKNPLACRIQP